MIEEEREYQAEWFDHPYTVKMRDAYIKRRWKQLALLVANAGASTDLRLVTIAAHLRALDLEVKNHGGRQMAFGDKDDGIGARSVEEDGGTEG